MNESLYRIVFNKARGCLMAVSELASSHSSGKDKSRSAGAGHAPGSQNSRFGASGLAGQDDGGRFGFPKPIIQAINSVVLMSMLLSSLSAPLSAYAQVRSDPNAPGNQRPTILNTANGLPQVNIQTPSAAGVSRNQYSQFDVDGRGVVINNSRTNTTTQLGGMVQGNPWLANGSARIIVNEVNSSNPSYLNGYIEIAGQRAEIIIANPSGISVNGGGFINTSSATLTTGSPIINGGNLEGYAVQKGTISIDGYGLDASLTDYTGILARSVQVNAGIWANNLNIVTGANQISADQGSSSPIAGVGGAPSFALDVSNLGGMYAGKISLVGTEAGLGVRNAGYLGASSGDVSITSEGMLVNSGLINSGANTSITAKGMVDNSGSISATGNASIDSKGEVFNTGSVSATGNISILTPGAISNTGQVYASGNTTLKAGGDIYNSGMVAAQGNNSLTTTATNGLITNTSSSVLAAGMTPDGKMLATGNLSLDADGLVTAKGLMIAGNQLSINSSSLDISGTNLNTGALALNAKKGDLDATGATISVTRELDLKAAQTLKTDAAIISAGNVAITADAWSNTKGQILQVGTADTTITVAKKIDNTEGYIASNGKNLSISSATLDNTNGDILHAGSGTLSITTGQLGLADGKIASNGSMTLTASDIDGAKGVLVSKDAMQVTVTGDVNLAGGQIGAGGTLALSAGSLNVSDGQVTSQGDLNLSVTGAVNNSTGLIASSKTVTLATGALNNNGGTIAGNAVDVNTHGQTLSSVSGVIASSTTLSINSGALNNDKGSIQSGGNMVLNTNGQALTNTGGDAATGKGILSQGTLTLNTGDLDNTAGYIAAVGQTSLTSSSLTNNATGTGATAVKGTIISNDELTITTTVSGLANVGGQIQSAKKLTLDVKGALDNTQGLVASSAEVDITAASIDNKNTKTETLVDKVDPVTHLVVKDANGNAIQETKLDIKGIQAKTVTLKAGAINNSQGGILASETLSIQGTGALTNTQGMIAAGDIATITASGLTNTQGIIQSTKKLSLDAGTGVLDNTQGLIASSSDVDVKAGSIINKNTKVETLVNKLDANGHTIMDNATDTLVQETKYDLKGIQGKNVSVTAGAIDNTEGALLASEALTITGSGVINNTKGMIAASKAATITATGLNNTEGTLQSAEKLTLNLGAGTLDNTKGLVAASTDVLITAGTVINKTTKTETQVNKLDANGQVVKDANGNPVKETRVDIKGIQGKTVTLNANNVDNTEGGILAIDSLLIKGAGVVNNTKGILSSTGDVVIKDTVAVDDPVVGSTAPATDTNIATKTQQVINTGGAIVANKKLTIDSKSLTGDGAILNAGTLVDVMQDTAGKQVKKNAAGKWVNVVNGVACTTSCTEVADADVSVRKVTADGTLLKKNANGAYIKVDSTGTPILVNGNPVVVATADVLNAKESTEGDIKIKLIDNFTQTAAGSIQANGNLDMRTKGDVANAGLLQARQALTLQANNIDNQFGGEISAGATQLAANGSITNRGLIDGGFTLLQANDVTNIGTGRIYGDQISILAGSLNNLAETVNTGTGAAKKSAVIAARERLDIGASVITNQDGALLMSLGDMVVGKDLDANGHAIGQADAFLNNSATVDVQGNLSLNTGLFMNKDLYGTSVSGTSVDKYIVYTKVDAADPGGNSIRFTGGKWDDHTGAARNCVGTTCPTDEQWNALYANPQTNGDATNATYVSTAGSWTRNDGTYVLTTTDGQVFNNDVWRITFVNKTTTTSGEVGVDPSSILVGGSMTLNAGTAVNDKSKIIVGGALTVTADNLQNIGGGGSSVMTQHDETWNSNVIGGTRKLNTFEIADWTPVSNYWSSAGEVSYNTVPVHTGTAIDNRKDVVLAIAQPAIAPAGPAVSAHAVGAVAGSNGTGSVAPTNTVSKVAGPNGVGMVVRTTNSNTAQLPTNSLYQIQPNHSPKGYLVETDPRFTQNKTWLGSDYMLRQLNYDPATQTQRLGDGFYEQKLIREQVAQLTGRRFIDDYTSDEEEYKALMNAGIQFAKQYNLIPGVALTAEQMALLTTDIVWLIEKEVTLPDGTKTKALVPQVYAVVKEGDIDGSGNLISAKTIDLKLKGDMVNSGLMAARGNLSIDAANITNLAGTLKGMDVSLLASHDFQSIQGNIVAGNNLKINAGNDVVILAGNLTTGGNADITAGRNLFLAAQERGSQLIENPNKFDKNGNRIDKDNYARSGTYDQTGGTMNIGGSLTMSAGNDFVAQGTQINAGGGVNISAGHDASITTAQKGSYYESVSTNVESNKKWYGTIKKTTTITHTNTDLTNTASNINGGSVNINAGHDVTIIGANINGAGGVQVHGGNNTNILAAYDIKEKIDTKKVETNALGRFIGSLGSLTSGIMPINPGPDNTPTDSSVTDVNSTRKALLPSFNGGSGNVSLTAGNTLTLQAPVINGAGFTYGGGQQTNFLLAVDSKEVSHTQTSRSLFWQSTQSNGSISQTAHLTNINVPVGLTNFVGAGGISVQLPAGSALPAQIAALAKQPGNEYLTDLANRSDIDWKRVDIINKTWDYKKEGLTQEGAIVVAIVVTALTMGTAAGAGAAVGDAAAVGVGEGVVLTTGAVVTTATGATISAAVGAATAAAITTLATQAAIALLNNKGDVAAALKELGSNENIKALVTAMITAGVLQGLGTAFNLPVGAGTSTTLLEKLQTNLINGVASSLITTAINGGNLEDALRNAIKNAVIAALAAQTAGVIGDLKMGDNPSLNLFTGTLAHAILGCVVGSATVGNSTGCAPGAGGAVVGELSAEWYGKTFGGNAADAATFAKLTTAIAGLVGGANAMTIAGITSANAVTNNYLNHTDASRLLELQKKCDAGTCTSQEAQERLALIQKDIDTTAKLRSCALNSSPECQLVKNDFANATQSFLPTQQDIQSWANEKAKTGPYTAAQLVDAYNANFTKGPLPASQTTTGDLSATADWIRNELSKDGPNVLDKVYMGWVTANAPSVGGSITASITANQALSKISTNIGTALVGKSPSSALNLQAIENLNSGLLPGSTSGKLGSPREMPTSINPNATAQDFAMQFLGRPPTAAELARGSAMMQGNCAGCWIAINADGAVISFRPAGKASDGTLPTTATVEINSPTINNLNIDTKGKPTQLKLKFPLVNALGAAK